MVPLQYALHFDVENETRGQRVARDEKNADGAAFEGVVDLCAPVVAGIDPSIIPEFDEAVRRGGLQK
jgi:hypothetical protein